jgi:tungstate transport system substrate-binding protein
VAAVAVIEPSSIPAAISQRRIDRVSSPSTGGSLFTFEGAAHLATIASIEIYDLHRAATIGGHFQGPAMNPPPLRPRRLLLLSALAAATAGPAIARGLQRQSLADPMRLGADDALVDSGLAERLQHAFSSDTGIALKVLRDPATRLLEATERGERDIALVNAPTLEAPLEREGLVHHRLLLATGDFLLVGPGALVRPLAAGRDAALALSRLAQVGAAFLTLGDGSGTHLAEQALWRAAKVAPAAPWYATAAQAGQLLREAKTAHACTLVERGAWLRHGGSGLAVLVEGDPRLAAEVHVMQSFRVHHPTAPLFTRWISGGAGRRVVASVAGYRAARG